MSNTTDLAVYKMNVDCGRMGNLKGVFVEPRAYVEKLIADKIEVYFGEVLGKHSEICGAIEKHEIVFVSDSPEVIKVIQDNGLESGYNPFDYTIIGSDDEDEEDMQIREVIEKRLAKA